jgi:hypothetical protein
MRTHLILMIGLIAAGGLGLVISVAARHYFRFIGSRLVTCPETKRTAAVSLDASKAALQSLLGNPRFRLSQCSRWPERRDCEQECLRQIEKAPEDCLLKNIVGKWYAEKLCAYCQKPFESTDDIFHHTPALMGKDLVSIEWDEIRPEELPEVFRSSLPICWNCHMAETFRRVHPEMTVDNPWQDRQGNQTHPRSGSKQAQRN